MQPTLYIANKPSNRNCQLLTVIGIHYYWITPTNGYSDPDTPQAEALQHASHTPKCITDSPIDLLQWLCAKQSPPSYALKPSRLVVATPLNNLMHSIQTAAGYTRPLAAVSSDHFHIYFRKGIASHWTNHPTSYCDRLDAISHMLQDHTILLAYSRLSLYKSCLHHMQHPNTPEPTDQPSESHKRKLAPRAIKYYGFSTCSATSIASITST